MTHIKVCVSHISQNTSEIWGTHGPVAQENPQVRSLHTFWTYVGGERRTKPYHCFCHSAPKVGAVASFGAKQ
jgi:hypothetical protein